METLDIIILLIFFGTASFISSKEAKGYELFVSKWKELDEITYVKYGNPEATNLSLSSLKIKYGFLMTGDYRRIINNNEILKLGRNVRVYFFIEHFIMLMFGIFGLLYFGYL